MRLRANIANWYSLPPIVRIKMYLCGLVFAIPIGFFVEYAVKPVIGPPWRAIVHSVIGAPEASPSRQPTLDDLLAP